MAKTTTTKRIQEKRDAITIEEMRSMLEAEGHEVCEPCSYIDEERGFIYVSSFKTVPGTYGHPLAELHYSRNTKWLVGNI